MCESLMLLITAENVKTSHLDDEEDTNFAY